MAKLHTRQKRKFRMRRVNWEQRNPRPKTFKSEEAAKKYAENQGIKNYRLVDMWEGKDKSKIKIVQESE